MILFPAIDLKNGEAVRLEQGDMARATVFHRDPAEQARAFAAQGFAYLHIVDLDGAFAGQPINAAAVERILAAVHIPVQLGGGIRDLATHRRLARQGRARVILGTAAVRNPALVKDAAKKFPGRIAVGIDARDGNVAVEGWAQTSELSATRSRRRFEDAGVAAIIYTDIARDGMLKGSISTPRSRWPTRSPSRSSPRAVLPRLTTCAPCSTPRAKKLAGAIVGRALYDGRLDAAAALAAHPRGEGGVTCSRFASSPALT